MVNKSTVSKLFITIFAPLLFASCAAMNSIIPEQGDEEASEIKEISVSKRLQISIPIPENSKYITYKTIIFGEGERFTGVLYLLHEVSADEVVEFYRVSMRDDGWSEIAIVRRGLVLMNFDKEDRFATIKVNRKVFDNSSSEVTVGPKTGTTINSSINIYSTTRSPEEQPFTIE